MNSPVALTIADLGYREEPPGSNRTKFGERFFPGQASPWCAEMISCHTRDAGARGPWNASVQLWMVQARKMALLVPLDQGLDAVAMGHTVAVGFEWSKDTWADHIAWLLGSPASGTIKTIDGNAPIPGGLGDGIGYHVRPTNLIAFCAILPDVAGVVLSPPDPLPLAPAHPTGPVLPAFMVLTWQTKKRPGFTNHGDKVGVLQSFFKNLGGGWDPGPVDGIIGPRTNDIIGRFQRSKGLVEDHEVGQRTWHAAFG